jgi:hypothetical protein
MANINSHLVVYGALQISLEHFVRKSVCRELICQVVLEKCKSNYLQHAK